MIKVRKLTKKYNGKIVFKNISFKFENKGLYFITGKSGIGKTTLLKIIAGEDLEFDGNVKVEKPIFYLKDKDNLVSNLTVKDNLILFEMANDKKIKYYYDIHKLFNKKVKKLSLGERQLVITLMALNTNREIVLLDEPFSALSKENIKIISEVLNKIKKDKMFIIVSHNTRLFNDYTLLDMSKLKEEKMEKFKTNYRKESKPYNLQYSLFYYKKALFQKMLFIISIIMNICSSIFIKNYTDDLFNLYVNDLTFNSGIVVEKDLEVNKIDENLFYEVIKKLGMYIKDYNASYYKDELYEKGVFIGDYYVDNGYTLSTFKYDENVRDNEVLLGINYYSFCKQNKIANCNEDLINKLLLNKEIKGIRLKVNSIFESEETIYIINKRFYKTEDNYDYVLYYFDVSKEDEKYIFDLINKDDYLLNFKFMKVGENETTARYRVDIGDSKAMTLNEGYHSYFACLEKGYNCTGYLNKFSLLVSIDEYTALLELDLRLTNLPLMMDEIIISSHLSEKLNKKKGEIITFYFNYNSEYKKVPLMIKEVISDSRCNIYHNSSWSYYFFKDYVGFSNKDLRVDNLVIYEDIKDGYKESESVYKKTLDDLKEIFESVKKGILIINVSASLLGVIVVILLERFNKFKKEYFAYLEVLGIKKECLKHS